jgi:ADP-heptose:LPS heptosyltransferase
MGDLIMSTPAIHALKEKFGCSITLLTSYMAAGIVPFIKDVDAVILYNAPWVKTNMESDPDELYAIIERIKEQDFDAAVIFTVFSQTPLVSAMIPFLAGIPKRLAYCRENPYSLLTHWIPDKEPYSFVRHQVQRDLELVRAIGADTQDQHLRLRLGKTVLPEVERKLTAIGVDWDKPWLLMHAGVSDPKRLYPQKYWIETGKQIINELGYQVILTGNSFERSDVEVLKNKIGGQAFNAAGLLSLEEFITIIKHAELVVSVNTSTIHIAAATDTPMVVLYALTNPQHLPWKARGKALLYDIPEYLRSNNQVLQFVHEYLHPKNIPLVMPADILEAVRDLITSNGADPIPDMVPLQAVPEQIL